MDLILKGKKEDALKGLKTMIFGVTVLQLTLLFISAINADIGKLCRMCISGLFVVCVSTYQVKNMKVNQKLDQVIKAIGGGVISCFFGDLILAGLTPIPIGIKVICGMGMFSLAQILLIITFVKIRKEKLLKVYSSTSIKTFITLVTITLIVVSVIVINSQTEPMLIIAIFLYATLIAFMASLAVSLREIDKTFVGIGVGAILFFLSDMIIAIFDFAGFVTPHKDNAIWITYTLGLIGIYYGLLLNHKRMCLMREYK